MCGNPLIHDFFNDRVVLLIDDSSVFQFFCAKFSPRFHIMQKIKKERSQNIADQLCGPDKKSIGTARKSAAKSAAKAAPELKELAPRLDCIRHFVSFRPALPR